uniref:Uncharacterized protein n=1 Tax=Daphnia galeata TaxID=27404 RepID=A0A8J2RE15_9CRUS|nr:unnamed protein product [Daphnia galeata]
MQRFQAESVWQRLQNQPELRRQLTECFSKLIFKLVQVNCSNDMRIQTAQLLHQFVRELPDRKLELSTVMEILTFQQAGDEQAPVRNWAWRSARCPSNW